MPERVTAVNSTSDTFSWLAHSAAFGIVAGWVSGLLSVLALVLPVIWFTIQIYQSHTMQKWLYSRRVQKLAKLEARKLVLLAAVDEYAKKLDNSFHT